MITVGDLRKALEGLPDEMPVAVNHDNEDWPTLSGDARKFQVMHRNGSISDRTISTPGWNVMTVFMIS